MTKQDAMLIVIDFASRWGENAEEDFPRRIKPNDTDADLIELLDDLRPGGDYDRYDLDRAIEIRDLWNAVELLHGATAP